MKAQKIRTTIAEIVGILLTIVMLAPFLLVIINSAKDSASIVISPISLPKNWGQLFTNMSNVIHNDNFNYWGSFFSSLLITAVSLILLTLFSSMAAWVLVRNKTKWSNFIFMLFVSAMVIPFQVVMLPLLSTFRETSEFLGIQMLQSYKGIIFAYLGFGGSMSVFILHGFVKGIPLEIEEAALIDGCSPLQVYFQILIPILKPTIISTAILELMWVWNDYLLPTLVLDIKQYRTIPMAVQYFRGSFGHVQMGPMMASIMIDIIPIIIVYLVCQKYIIEGVVAGAVKG